MSDTIGRITVPSLVDSGLTFPFTSDMGYGYSQDWPIVVHRFGSYDAKCEQRYQVGIGPKKHAFRRQHLSLQARNQLFTFWESLEGPWKTFTYNAPAADQSLSAVKVIWEQAPLSAQYLVNACQAGFNFLEVPDPSTAPSYAINSTCTRFPSSALQSALLSQVQQIVPLVHIRVREAAVPDIYLSDRRCTVGGQLYLPRLLSIGEQGSDDLIVQDLEGTSDSVSFTFGNADRVMTQLSNDTDLRYARVELSLYHVNTGILIQLWAGQLLRYATDGSPKFSVQAGDPLAQVTRLYPTRTISRTCWKTFNDGVNCPYSTASTNHGGDPASCDYYFDSANGCQAHGMDNYFGGLPASPQGVNIKDNSTGTWGIGRNTVTATSIVSDSVFGNALQEIWCNSGGDPTKAFWLNTMIIAVRDESDFVDALGIVGAGPIGAWTPMTVATNADGFRYIVAPLLDGQPPHGFTVDGSLNITRDEPNYGLVEVAGGDPQPNVFGLNAGGTPQGNAKAAGTAWIEVRRTDQSGIQPSTPEQHTLQAVIDKGLSGYVWDASGNRTLVAGLTNPFWIAINSYLRSIGLFNADSATQLNAFVSSSVFAGDGTGAAEIADSIVNVLVGTGTENQFLFQGVLAQQKPFRDWLTEILAVGLGYFTWEFGRLKLGCRMNASAVDSYGLGNMLFQSLQLEPIEPKFEHLILDFADVEYQYQANTAEYQDKDHANYYGRGGTPLTSRMHSVGISTLSQALRVAATRTREEIGGISAAEWLAARNATWGTTLLGLNNGLGQVVSLVHPDVPGGTGKFRIRRWSLKKDWSIVLQGKTVTDSMYDLTVGPKPMDVLPSSLPPLRYPLPLNLVWNPYQVQAAASDPLFPNEWNFDVSAAYSTLADGSASAVATITGKLPVNDYSAAIYGAPVIGSLAVNATGGSMAGNVTVRLAVCAIDSAGEPGNISAIALVSLSAGNTWQIVLNNITWPGASGSIAGYVVFASWQDDLLCEQITGTGTPSSITLNGPLVRSTWGIPSSYLNKVRLKGKRELYAGVTYGKVTAATGNTITVTDPATGVPFVSGAYSGRILSVIGRSSASIPFLNFTITGISSDTFTLDRAVTGVNVGDLVVVRFAGGTTSTTLSDSAASFTASALVGNVVRVIAGTGRGSIQKITANTSTGITLAGALTLDSTSVWIVEEAAWSWSVDGTTFDNALNTTQAQWALPMSNLSSQAVLVSGFTVDIYGNETPDGDQPIRECWLSGYAPATTTLTPILDSATGDPITDSSGNWIYPG